MLTFLLALAVQDPAVVAAPGHWPQWRGPARDGVSTERNLLREWPAGGPPLLWTSKDLGEGVGCVSVAGGLIFAQGNSGDRDVVVALDGRGRLVWSAELGPATGERAFMRYATQRSPTVDEGLLYVTTWQGMVNCLDAASGRIVWRKEYGKDLEGKAPYWAWGDAPLVDGRRLICIPGGSKGTLAALDKLDGSTLWRSEKFTDMVNAPVVAAELGGLRQLVVLGYHLVAGVALEDGRLLWSAERIGRTVVTPTPLVHDGIVFVASGHGVGHHAFRVAAVDGAFKAEPLYAGRELENNFGGVVRVGEHLYGTGSKGFKCVELKTGKEVWTERSIGKGSVLLADGLLLCRAEKGTLDLVEPAPEGFREKGRFDQPGRTKELAHTHPVVAGGRLYLRDQETLHCYDLRGPDYKHPRPVWNLIPRIGVKDPKAPPSLPPAEGKAPDAAFVPTPQDVVEKMLETAQVTAKDLVVDLGSGDGRIPITAAKAYGCTALGLEIDEELLRTSRKAAADAGVDARVAWEKKDLFTADLSAASVVTLYLGASNNARLLPQLRALRPGARIVSHEHLLGPEGPKPDRTLRMICAEDGAEHLIHVWTAPLAK